MHLLTVNKHPTLIKYVPQKYMDVMLAVNGKLPEEVHLPDVVVLQ